MSYDFNIDSDNIDSESDDKTIEDDFYTAESRPDKIKDFVLPENMPDEVAKKNSDEK